MAFSYLYRSCFLLIIMALVISCSVHKKSYNPLQKYSSQQLNEDFNILNDVLLHHHPGLYWYTTKDSLDNYFSGLQHSLTDSLTEQQFKNRVAYAVSKIHCGHTTVRPSEQYVKYYSKTKTPQFPLWIKIWKDSAVVFQNFIADSVISKGTIVKAINNRSMSYIKDSLFQLIGTDGYADVFKYQAISLGFPAYYKNAFGTDSLYTITYIDSNGIEKNHTLRNYYPSVKENANNKQDSLSRKSQKILELNSKRNVNFDFSTNSAFMPVNTFSSGKLRRFFRKSFSLMKQHNTQNLIIDLRVNTGGDVLACTKLLQYLVRQPFKMADTVAAKSKSFVWKKYTKPWFWYWLSMVFSTSKKVDGKMHFNYFERHTYQPKKQNHFDGNIYLITGGFTFSGATFVAGKLKGQSNVTIVGEETGGGYYGNNAIYLPTLTLPNTKINITIPLFKVVWDKKRIKNGRGVMPDVEIRPNALQLKKGIDAKLERVLQLINQNTKR